MMQPTIKYETMIAFCEDAGIDPNTVESISIASHSFGRFTARFSVYRKIDGCLWRGEIDVPIANKKAGE